MSGPSADLATRAPVFCSCAITGGMSVPGQSAAIPVTPEEIVESAVAANAAGAAIVHVHVREPSTGKPIADLGLFKEVLAGIGERCDAIVQPTSGGGVGMTIEERARVVTECRPEMATFNCGSFNFGIFKARHRPEMAPWEIEYLESTRGYIFKNTFADMHRLSELFREAGTKPEYEVYDVGHVYNLAHLAEEGLVDFPIHVQFVLGVLGANTASIDQLVHMRRTAESVFGRENFTWSAAGVGYPGQFHLAARRADDGRAHAGRARGQPAGAGRQARGLQRRAGREGDGAGGHARPRAGGRRGRPRAARARLGEERRRRPSPPAAIRRRSWCGSACQRACHHSDASS